MKLKLSALLLAFSLTATAQVSINQESVVKALMAYKPGVTAFARPSVKDVLADDKAKTLKIIFNESAVYIPLTLAQVDELKQSIKEVLPKQYAKYRIELECEGESFEALASDARRDYVAPKEKGRFVTYEGRQAAPGGLDGSNIAVWQSHGRYYNQKTDEWMWQRPNLYQTCEDLFTQTFVMPFLNPMLENAGAYVLSPRERDTNEMEYILDNDWVGCEGETSYNEVNGEKEWSATSKPGFAMPQSGALMSDENPFKGGTARQVATVGKGSKNPSLAQWIPGSYFDEDNYAVYVSYQSLPNSATDALYTVNAADGPHHIRVNQRMGGGTWIYLGHFDLKGGEEPLITLSNVSGDKNAVVTADGVKIGGGMGNVFRSPKEVADSSFIPEPKTSGYPRFTEGSRYWLQWAGAPDSVYSQTHFADDYTDDYTSRGRWVNWLTGGSSVLPDREGLGIPIDLSFAFHSDAGITPNDSVIGVLGIYYTNNRKNYANGNPRLAARDLTNMVVTNITDDVRATYEPQWTRRGMWNRNYAEVRVSEAPAMLLELLSHQNLADMKLGLDPGFRFVVSRAIYKGMLQYIARRDGRPYVVQPLPVHNMSLVGSEGKYRLSWSERVDSLEPTAKPTYYIIQERVNKLDDHECTLASFREVAKVTDDYYDITISDNHVHSYRVIAGNDGGISFPSEVLALCDMPGTGQVMVVNGFTRVSAPDSYDYGEAAGFDNRRDPGVPYIREIGYVGEQFEDRRNIPWMTDESAGMGASRSDFEGVVVAGNTFDFVYKHGMDIARSGHGFISSSVEAFTENGTDAPVVDLILGNQKENAPGSGRVGTRFKTFPAPLQQQLRKYTEGGGNVFVSGSFIATDLWNNPFSSEDVAKADREFAKEVLGYVWRCGAASPAPTSIYQHNIIYGEPSRFGLFEGLRFKYNNELSTWKYAVISPDGIGVADSQGAAVLGYGHSKFAAGTAFVSPTHRAIAVGVPFESINENGYEFMQIVLDFLFDKK